MQRYDTRIYLRDKKTKEKSISRKSEKLNLKLDE